MSFMDDRRIQAAESSGLLRGGVFDEKSMTIEFEIEHCENECPNFESGVQCDCGYCQDEEGYVTLSFPCRFVVCDTCGGKGSHVNPSIDAHGITQEEFDEDPEFRENYFSGAYDVPCYECHGKRVVPEIDEESLTVDQRQDYECVVRKERQRHWLDAAVRSERMRGA